MSYNNEDEPNTDEIGAFYTGKARRADERKGRLSPFTMAVLLTVGFVLIIWYAYPKGDKTGSGADVPVIRAVNDPYKAVPADEGGLAVPHQDSTVFNAMEGGTISGAGNIETIIPSTEEPLAPAVVADDTTETAASPVMKLDAIDDAKNEDTKVGEGRAATVDEPEIVAAPKTPVAPVKEQPKAKTTAPVAGGVYMQLGAFKSGDAAEKDWTRLKAKFPTELGSLSHRVVKVDLAKGTFHRLQAGPVASASAKTICSKLASQNAAGCMIVK